MVHTLEQKRQQCRAKGLVFDPSTKRCRKSRAGKSRSRRRSASPKRRSASPKRRKAQGHSLIKQAVSISSQQERVARANLRSASRGRSREDKATRTAFRAQANEAKTRNALLRTAASGKEPTKKQVSAWQKAKDLLYRHRKKLVALGVLGVGAGMAYKYMKHDKPYDHGANRGHHNPKRFWHPPKTSPRQRYTTPWGPYQTGRARKPEATRSGPRSGPRIGSQSGPRIGPRSGSQSHKRKAWTKMQREKRKKREQFEIEQMERVQRSASRRRRANQTKSEADAEKEADTWGVWRMRLKTPDERAIQDMKDEDEDDIEEILMD